MTETESGLPYVQLHTIESIIDEVFHKNTSFGVTEFISNMEDDNTEMCIVLYSLIDAIADQISGGDNSTHDQYAAIAKITCHLLYKSLAKQLEINTMES
jgi:hypothetical protein|tara:strand:+ start:489 stop:785 length:297 start_codon:yes stop_codon:yes gene_type:complete